MVDYQAFVCLKCKKAFMSTAKKHVHCTYCNYLGMRDSFKFLGKDEKSKLITKIISNYNGRENENCFVTYEDENVRKK